MPQGIGVGGAACKTYGLVWRKGEAFPHIEQSRTHQAQSFRAVHMWCDTDRLFIHLKDFRKVFADAILNCAHFNFASQQFFHRSDRLAFAGNNQIKVAEIGIHVERESVGGHPARDVYADRGDFAALRVYTGQAGNAKRFDIKVVHRANQDFFQIAYEAMHVFAIRAQVNNWIADDLAQPVIRNFAASVGFTRMLSGEAVT